MRPLDKNHSVLISAAVKDELDIITSKLLNLKTIYINDNKVISGTINHANIMLIATGPGVVNTAHTLTSVINQTRPSLLIQTGCAGAFKESGIATGDIGIATCEIDVHTGIESEESQFSIPTPLPFPIASKNNIKLTNIFPTDKALSHKALSILSKNRGFKVVKGPFITVSTITATDKRMKALYDGYTPCMESMEGSAAAHIAFLYEIPFIEIRSASNSVGKRDKSSWDLPLAFKNSNMAVFDLINTITGN